MPTPRILIAVPSAGVARTGNQITAQRWSAMLRQIGWQVTVRAAPTPTDWDKSQILVALHAKRSSNVVQGFHRRHPNRPIVVAMTGTDLAVLPADAMVRRSLDLATRVVVLQPAAIEELPAGHRPRARVILQSAQPVKQRLRPLRNQFEVCVMGHLRSVKDPFRTALAARKLPVSSRILVSHLGGALSPGMRQRAEREMECNPRYRWLGNRPRGQALQWLGRSRVLSLTSKSEGAPSVVSEAIVAHVPVISAKIPSMIGLLGEDYPGFFPVGDTASLTNLLRACEEGPSTLAALRAACATLEPLFSPHQERIAWSKLLAELPPLSA